MKVLTLNINQYGTKHGPWPERRRRIAEAVRASDPDVVALQAVGRAPESEGGLSQAEELAADLPQYARVVFEPASKHPDGAEDGNAVLSRVPVTAQDRIALTLSGPTRDPQPRLVQAVRLAEGERELHLFNAHFSWDEPQNANNMREAAAWMRGFRGPAMLVGDFNATPDKPPIEELRREGWTDVWAEKRPGEDGYTFEPPRPALRIDYAWTNTRIARSIEIVGATGDGERLSDHLGLSVALDL